MANYIITFVDDDNTTILQQEELEEGVLPVYNGETPTKPATAQYTYTFAGWAPQIVEVTEDATYIAVYEETLRKYNITFVDEDNITILKEATEYAYGTPANAIVKPANPIKKEDASYTYTFDGWVPTITSVNGNATYKASYETHRKSFIDFFTTPDNQYDKYEDGVSSGIEKINKTTIEKLYEELAKELIKRGGYQSVACFVPNENNLKRNNNTVTNWEKVPIEYFNEGMNTRQYIIPHNGNADNLYEEEELIINRIKNYYKENKEEWYQKSDKDKIETLIYDLHKGKKVPLDNTDFTENTPKTSGNPGIITTGCNNICTGTCSNTCGGTQAAWYTPELGDQLGCNGGCKTLCLNYCDSKCSSSCGETCGTACVNICGGQCSSSCGSDCANGCAGCDSSCSGECDTDCSDNCSGDCASGCGGCYSGCTGGCMTACHKTCGGACASYCGDCTNSCEAKCKNDCADNCVAICKSYGTKNPTDPNQCADCTGSCVNSCSGCSSYCYGGCSSGCQEGCKTGCQSCEGCTLSCQVNCGGCATTCTDTCGSGCNTGCAGCSGGCGGKCVDSCKDVCGAACNTKCSNQCQNNCGTKCTGDCQNSCYSYCNDSCKSTNASLSDISISDNASDGCGNSCTTGCNIYCTGCSGNCAGLGAGSVNGTTITDGQGDIITLEHRKIVWTSNRTAAKYTGAKDGFVSGEDGYNSQTSQARTTDNNVSGGPPSDNLTGTVTALSIDGYTIQKQGNKVKHNPDYPHGSSTHTIPS